MNFVLDANIPYSAKKIFKEPANVVHVRDVDLDTAPDKAIIRYAAKQKAIVVTRDLEFANIIIYPPENHAGVLVLRVPSSFVASQIINLLRKFLEEVDLQTLPKAVTILEPGKYRIRNY